MFKGKGSVLRNQFNFKTKHVSLYIKLSMFHSINNKITDFMNNAWKEESQIMYSVTCASVTWEMGSITFTVWTFFPNRTLTAATEVNISYLPWIQKSEQIYSVARSDVRVNQITLKITYIHGENSITRACIMRPPRNAGYWT